MNKRYDGLFDMMALDDSAEEYFDSLPDYVRDSICDRADNIHTVDELKAYADNLLRGDL